MLSKRDTFLSLIHYKVLKFYYYQISYSTRFMLATSFIGLL